MGHDGHGDRAARFRDRLWGSLALSAPVLVYGETLQHWFGYAAPRFPGSHWIAPVFGTLVLLHGGRPFLSGAVDEAAARRPGTMLLIAQALAAAYAAGLAAAFGLFDLDLWWELALLVDVLLLGHRLEARAFGRTPDAPPPDVAERVEDGTPVTVAAGEPRVGDTVLVRPGARPGRRDGHRGDGGVRRVAADRAGPAGRMRSRLGDRRRDGRDRRGRPRPRHRRRRGHRPGGRGAAGVGGPRGGPAVLRRDGGGVRGVAGAGRAGAGGARGRVGAGRRVPARAGPGGAAGRGGLRGGRRAGRDPGPRPEGAGPDARRRHRRVRQDRDPHHRPPRGHRHDGRR